MLTDPSSREPSAWQAGARTAAPWLLGSWLTGAVLVLGLLFRDVRRISSVTRRSAVLRRGPLYQLARQVAAELGVRQRVRLAVSRELAVPLTWGLLRPVVLLPVEARRWDEGRRRVVLRHELAHICRGDYAGHLLIELGCALHWVNPFAWRAAHRARLEQEQACDDRVLGLGTHAVDYAEHLLDMARRFVLPAVPGRGALAMAAVATLPERIRSILDARLDHRPAGRRTVLAVVTAGLLVGVPTAALHPWSDGPRDMELRAALRSTDPMLRRQAIWELGVRRSTGSLEALIERLQDRDPAARGVAAWALGKLGNNGAVEPLVGALRDGDAHVREMAVLALGELGEAGTVPALTAMVADPAPGVRSVLTVALRGLEGEPAAEALARLVESDPDAHTRSMAVAALSRRESHQRVGTIQGALADSAPEVRATAAWSLRNFESSASVPRLIEALDRELDPEAREAMVHALGTLGDERAAQPLMAATRDSDHQVRLTAVWALDALQQNR